jgi:hypothetical protein
MASIETSRISRDLRQPALELGDGLAQAPARLLAIVGGEDRADDRPERVVLVAADVAAEIAQEVHVMPTSA